MVESKQRNPLSQVQPSNLPPKSSGFQSRIPQLKPRASFNSGIPTQQEERKETAPLLRSKTFGQQNSSIFSQNGQKVLETKQRIAQPVKKQLTTTNPRPGSMSKPMTTSQRNNQRNLAHIKKLEGNKFEDNQLKELELKRFNHAKQRLKDFIVYSDMSDEQERNKILHFFAKRYASLMSLLKEAVRAKKLQKSTVSTQLKAATNEEPKIFILSSKDYPTWSFSEEEIKAQQEELLVEYRKTHGLAPNQKVAAIFGNYQDMAEELEQRGYHTYWTKKQEEADRFLTQVCDYVYTTKARDAFKMPLPSDQLVNHIKGVQLLSTKVGLTHSMNNLVWHSDFDISTIFPCSFDISDPLSAETMDFKENFKFGQVISFLKIFTNSGIAILKKNQAKVIICISIAERRVKMLSGQIFDQISKGQQFGPNELDTVSDLVYDLLTKQNQKEDFQKQSWFRPIQKRFADVPAENILDLAKEILAELNKIIGDQQFGLTDMRNQWIIKPGGKSRGRGIEIHSDLGDLLQRVNQPGEFKGCWVAQKYIERPLIIIGKKFDIRQWVLVSSIRPLIIWMYKEPYCRFTSQDYDPNKVRNKFAHLCNACVTSKFRF